MLEKISNFFANGEQSQEELDAQAKNSQAQNMIDQAILINSDAVINRWPKADMMYEGRHWDIEVDGITSDRLEGYSKLVHNFIADIVDRWTMFIGSNPPVISVQNLSEYKITSDVTSVEQDVSADEDEADAVKKIIMRCQKQRGMNWRSLFMRIAHTQSRYGRVLLYVHLAEGKHYPVWELLRYHDSFPVYDSIDNQTLLYFVNRKLVDRIKLAEKMGVAPRDLPIDQDHNPVLSTREITQRERTYYYRIITAKEIMHFANGRIFKSEPHEYGCVPIFSAQNRTAPFDSIGKDDISDNFRDNMAYNMAYSNLVDATEDQAIGKRLIRKPGQTTDMSMLYDRQQRHVVIGPETEITDLAPKVALSEIISTMNEVKRNIEDNSGITELLKGRFSGSIATGVALSGLSRGIEDMARQKIINLSEMLEQSINFSLFLLKKFKDADPDSGVKYSEILKRDWYNLDFFWDNMSIQDERTKASTEIDLVNAGMKSRLGAMKALRIEYPEDEQTRVAYEKMNPMLNPELAIQLAQKDLENTGFSPDEELLKAKKENSLILRGENPPVTETNPGQHAIHVEEHKKVLTMARGKQREVLLQHISAHEKGANQVKESPAAPQPSMPGQAPMQPGASAPVEGARPQAQEGVPNPQALA